MQKMPRCYYLKPCQSPMPLHVPHRACRGENTQPAPARRDSKLFTQQNIYSPCFPRALTMAIISSNNKHRGQRRGTASSPEWFPDSRQHPALPRTPRTHPAFLSQHRAPARLTRAAAKVPVEPKRRWRQQDTDGSKAPGVCRDGHAQPSSDPLQTTPLFKILTFILIKKKKGREATGSYTNLQFIIFFKNDMKHK